MKEIGVPGENRPATSHSQILSQKVIWNTPCHRWKSN